MLENDRAFSRQGHVFVILIDLELHHPVPKKAIGAAAFVFVGPDRWNKLHERLRGSASLNISKRDLKTHMFMNTF